MAARAKGKCTAKLIDGTRRIGERTLFSQAGAVSDAAQCLRWSIGPLDLVPMTSPFPPGPKLKASSRKTASRLKGANWRGRWRERWIGGRSRWRRDDAAGLVRNRVKDKTNKADQKRRHHNDTGQANCPGPPCQSNYIFEFDERNAHYN